MPIKSAKNVPRTATWSEVTDGSAKRRDFPYVLEPMQGQALRREGQKGGIGHRGAEDDDQRAEQEDIDEDRHQDQQGVDTTRHIKRPSG